MEFSKTEKAKNFLSAFIRVHPWFDPNCYGLAFAARRIVFSGLAALIIFQSPWDAAGQPAPKINSISPETIRRGSSTEVALEGDNLSSATNFLFFGSPGVSAVVAPPATPSVGLESSAGGISVASTRDPKKFHLKVTVAEDAPLGSREFRVVAPGGVSNPFNLGISDLKEEMEKEPNNLTNEATRVQLPAALNGVVHAGSEIDLYRFSAKKGERVIFDLNAARSGSPLDSSVSVLDLDGKELIRSEDANGFDSLVDFSVPADGDYFLQVRDFRFQGGANYKYRVVAGVLPYIDAIFPYGGQRGQNVEVKLMGRNLEGANTLKLSIDAGAPLGPQDLRTQTPRGFSNPARFEVGAFADTREQEPNESTNLATTVTVPGAINGRIEREKDEDFFKFKVEKGQRLIFDVMANRFGSPLDAVLTLFGTNGTTVLQKNDDTSAADARIDQTFPEAGEYYLSLKDLLDSGGELYGYRIAVNPPGTPNFNLQYSPDVVRLHRGATTVIKFDVTRSGGFAGGVEVLPESLPMGVTAFPLLIVPESASGLLFLTATESAQLGHLPLKFKGRAPMAGKMTERKARPAAGREGFINIFELAPFSLDPLTLSSAVEQNQSASLEVAVNRRNNFTGEVKLSVEGLNLKNIEVTPVVNKSPDPKSTLTVKAKNDADVGPREIYLKGETTVDGVVINQVTRPIPFNVLEFPFVLSSTLPRLAVTAGSTNRSAASEAEFSVKVARKGLFTDEISLALEGIPEGITFTQTNLVRNVGEALFKLASTEKAKINTTNKITIVGTSTVNGRTLTHRGPEITLFINPPATEIPVTNLTTNLTNSATAPVAPAPAK